MQARRETFGYAALVAVLLVVIVAAWALRDDDPPGRAIDRTDTPAATDSSSASPAKHRKRERRTAEKIAATPSPAAGWAGNESLPPGLAGTGASRSMQTFTLRLSVTSSAAIRTLGYQVPTSRGHESRVVRGVGSSWSLTTQVYGRPDYARIFLQAGPDAAITCTITVEGRVTDRRTTQGPYGATMCQG